MLGSRKDFLCDSCLFGRNTSHQQANAEKTTSLWWYVPKEDLLWEALGKDLEFSPNGNSSNVSSLSLSLSLSLSPELRVLTIIMFHNLYPLSSTGYMNLGRALFLHDLISDVEIYICAHIFHILCKTVVRTDSRICIPFLSAASFHRFWNLKAFIHQLISLPIQSQVQSTFERQMLALVIAKRESNQNHILHTVDHALPHTPVMKS